MYTRPVHDGPKSWIETRGLEKKRTQKEPGAMPNELPAFSGCWFYERHSDAPRRGTKSLGTDVDNRRSWLLSLDAFPSRGLFGTTSIISRWFFPLEILRLSCGRKNSLRMIVNSGCSSLRTFVSERHTSRRKWLGLCYEYCLVFTLLWCPLLIVL